jgi:AraC family transcriptional regulator of adaptative response / methylphosphotriester-DNA alkyltransferase methyltransferase
MSVSPKLLTRKDEITADFLRLFDQYMDDLLHGRVSHKVHTSTFAGLLFIHPTHLTNTVKSTTGKSPCEIMEDRIIVESQKMLNDTKLSVADISYKLAFNEPTYFIRFFKNMTGITPLQYRKRAK